MGEDVEMSEIPLCRMFVDDEIKEAVNDVLESGWYVKGKNAKALEEEFASFCTAKHGISASSGTAAIYLALKAIGIEKGDEVIVPSATFIASVNPIILCGGIPVFADIEYETNTISIEEINRLVTPKTKAIIPVHLYGHPAEMQPIMGIAKDHDLKIIEDACQAHGAESFGHKIGTIGDITCFSFFPSKNMSVLGEGGMITTNDSELAHKMAIMKDHGREDKHTSVIFGLNLRLSEIHAAIGRVQLKHLSEWVEKRRENAAYYSEVLCDVSEITVPVERTWAKHVYYVYVIKTEKRDGLQEHLKSKGISSGVHYRIPVHMQPFILDNFPQVNLPNTEMWANRILSLPMDPQITEEEIQFVADEIKNFFKG
jgi:dTDP-4-amino-4,6-dideoxygalactose transaminase